MHTPASGTEAAQPRFDRDIEQQDTPIKPEDFVTHNGLLLVCPFTVTACRDPWLLHDADDAQAAVMPKRLITNVQDLLTPGCRSDPTSLIFASM